MSNEEYELRLEELESLMTINEQKNEDDNAALAREISRLWDYIDKIAHIVENHTMRLP